MRQPVDFIPKEYQQIAQDFLLATPRCALFAGMGMGKTVSALNVIDILYLTGNSDPILVLAPLRVARDTWPQEVTKWNHLKDLSVSPIIGNPMQRRAALRTPAHIYTMNYENLPWLMETFKDKAWPFRTIIPDESTRLKNFRLQSGGQRSTALAAVQTETDRWIELTGTPSPNGLKDLWGQYWFIDRGERLGRTYTAFMERWFRKKYSGHGVELMPHSEREIHAKINDVTLALRPKDWFDLKDPIVSNVEVYLPPAALAQYKKLETQMFAELECGTQIEVFNSAALTNKCLQFASGAVYTEHPKWAPVHDRKLEALDSIVQEANGASILVSYEFQSERARILKAFPQAVDISTKTGLAEFKAGTKQIGIAHPASMGHGIDGLQEVCNMLVYFGYTWNLEYHQQILERIGPMRQLQSGKDRPVWVWRIVTSGTLDEDVLKRHESKCSVQDALLEAMARRT